MPDDDPRRAINWTLPQGLSGGPSLMDRLSGPGMTGAEAALTALALALGLAHAHASAPPDWSAAQYWSALALALLNCSAAVQCATATSKRWYHAGGRLPDRLLCVMVVEVVSQICLVGALFFDDEQAGWAFAARGGGFFAAALPAVHFAPRRVQRPAGLLALGALGALLAGGAVGAPRGLAWFLPVMGVKFLVSHVVRHEPYG